VCTPADRAGVPIRMVILQDPCVGSILLTCLFRIAHSPVEVAGHKALPKPSWRLAASVATSGVCICEGEIHGSPSNAAPRTVPLAGLGVRQLCCRPLAAFRTGHSSTKEAHCRAILTKGLSNTELTHPTSPKYTLTVPVEENVHILLTRQMGKGVYQDAL